MLRGQPETDSNYSPTLGLAAWPGTSVCPENQSIERPATSGVGRLQNQEISRYLKELREVGIVEYVSDIPVNTGKGESLPGASQLLAQHREHTQCATVEVFNHWGKGRSLPH